MGGIDRGKSWDPAHRYHDAAVAADYDRQRFSSLAGRIFNALEKRLVRRAFASCAAGTAVVDVPCGTGRLAEILLESGFAVTGIDVSPAMLAIAQARLRRFGARFEARVLDARELASSSLSFEAALCARVLMHLPVPEQAAFLRAVAAVTRTRLVFTQGVDTPYHRLRRRLKRALGHQAPSVHPLTPRQLTGLVAAAGLREIARYKVLPLVSESLVVVTAPLSR